MSDTSEVERIRTRLAEFNTMWERLRNRAEGEPYDMRLSRQIDEFGYPSDDIDTLLRITDQQQAVIDAAGDAIRFTRTWMRAPLDSEGHKEAARMLREVQMQIDTLAALGTGESD